MVDANTPTKALTPVGISVYDAAGALVASGTTGADGTFAVGGQLPTGTGLTVVAAPSGPTAPYLQSTLYCKFDPVSVPGVSVTAGATTALGDLKLPHQPGPGQDAAC